ncbi:MAG: hypothetical protein V9F06_04380 [Thermomicrobiales bacterium]
MSEKPRRDRYRFPESRDSRIAMVATLFVFLIVMAIFIVIIIRQGTYTIGSPTPVTLVGSERMLATAHTCVSQLQAGPPNLTGGQPPTVTACHALPGCPLGDGSRPRRISPAFGCHERGEIPRVRARDGKDTGVTLSPRPVNLRPQ